MEAVIKIFIREVTDKQVTFLFPMCEVDGVAFRIDGKKVAVANQRVGQITYPREGFNMAVVRKRIKSFYPAQLRPLIEVENVSDYIKKQNNQR